MRFRRWGRLYRIVPTSTCLLSLERVLWFFRNRFFKVSEAISAERGGPWKFSVHVSMCPLTHGQAGDQLGKYPCLRTQLLVDMVGFTTELCPWSCLPSSSIILVQIFLNVHERMFLLFQGATPCTQGCH